MRKKLKICFMGGKQAGIVGALTALSQGHEIVSAVSYSSNLTNILDSFGIPVYRSIKDRRFVKNLSKADIILSVHGREFVKQNLLALTRLGGINVHPYLYKYKGAKPVERAFREQVFKASVGAHFMEDGIDMGKVLTEDFVDVSEANSQQEIYNLLYPCYSIVILKTLDKICTGHKKYPNEVKDIRLRNVRENDYSDILSWRNHPAVRSQSFIKRKISRSEHKRWFFNKLHNKNTKIFIAEKEGEEKIGQIRFDIIKGRSARVNVNLNPIFIGKGLGSWLIAEGTRLFLKENPGVKIVKAEILDKNIVSKKAFQKMGYIFSCNILKNNKKGTIYEFGN